MQVLLFSRKFSVPLALPPPSSIAQTLIQKTSIAHATALPKTPTMLICSSTAWPRGQEPAGARAWQTREDQAPHFAISAHAYREPDQPTGRSVNDSEDASSMTPRPRRLPGIISRAR